MTAQKHTPDLQPTTYVEQLMVSRIQELESLNAELLGALEVWQTAAYHLAETAGDVPEWNKGGVCYEASKKARAAIAKANGS